MEYPPIPMGGSAHDLLPDFDETGTSFAYHGPAQIYRKVRMTMSENRRIRILLVEEEALVRAALYKLLESWSEYEVVGEAGSREEALEMLQHLDLDVILLAVSGDEFEDTDTVRTLAQASNGAQILILMGEAPSGFATELVRAGARGVVCKNKAPSELRRAIPIVHGGREIWLDRASLATLVTASSGRVDRQNSQLNDLTPREREVVFLVTKGLKNKEVGERLFISETTVRHHLTTIFDKLDVRNRFELINQLHRSGSPVSKESTWATGRGKYPRRKAEN